MRKPQKGCFSRTSRFTARRVERSGRRSRLWDAATRANESGAGKRVRGGRAKSLPRRTWQALEGENPGEHPAPDMLTACRACQGLPEGSKPRSRGSDEPALHFGAGIPSDETAGGFFHPETGRIPFAEEKAPKGESQERCRYETRPARNRGAEAVKRVTKP